MIAAIYARKIYRADRGKRRYTIRQVAHGIAYCRQTLAKVPRIIVLNELFHPAWYAHAGNRWTLIFRANVVMHWVLVPTRRGRSRAAVRAVLPAGSHHRLRDGGRDARLSLHRDPAQVRFVTSTGHG